MEPASLCIGTHEPVFIIALTIGLASAVLLAGVLVKLEARLRGQRLAFLRRSLAWGAAEAAVFVGPVALTVGLYAWQHPEQELCTSLVWRWYFMPPVVLVITGVSWGIWDAVVRKARMARLGA